MSDYKKTALVLGAGGFIGSHMGGIEGTVTSSATGLNFNNSNFTITDPGKSFQFTTTYQGPGITNQTVIQRTTEVISVTDTTSIFTQ
jgi:hypothetical protein